MKKFINKYLFVALAASMFASCSDEDNSTWAPGEPAGSNNVTFVCDGPVTIAKTATSFEVTLVRDNATSALEVPITVIGSEGFTIPTSASFASGAEQTSITIGVPADMALNTGYDVELRIPMELTNPYKDQATYPVFKAAVIKEDYEAVCQATYFDNFWYEESWEVTLEYSPAQDLYRVKDMFEPGTGYDFFFKWNKETNVVTPTDASGAKLTQVPTPYLYQDVNAITGRTDQAIFTYVEDEDSKYFSLPFYWYVPALSGGFGIYECYLLLN